MCNNKIPWPSLFEVCGNRPQSPRPRMQASIVQNLKPQDSIVWDAFCGQGTPVSSTRQGSENKGYSHDEGSLLRPVSIRRGSEVNLLRTKGILLMKDLC